MHDHVRIVERCLHDRIQVYDTLSQLNQLRGSFLLFRGREDADRVPDVAEADPEKPGFHDPSVDKGAFRLGNDDVFIRAVLQHICRRKVARVDQKDLAVLQIRGDPLDQLLMEIRLNVDDHDLRAADLRNITGHSVDMS